MGRKIPAEETRFDASKVRSAYGTARLFDGQRCLNVQRFNFTHRKTLAVHVTTFPSVSFHMSSPHFIIDEGFPRLDLLS